MKLARILDAFLVLLAVTAVIAPVRTLFTPDTWILPALLCGLSVTAVGIAVRSLTRRDSVVVLAQIAVGVLLICWGFARSHLWYGLPYWPTVLALNELLYEARITITEYAPPAPTGPGIVLMMVMIAWVAVLVVDFVAVTRRAPALAGIPLFVAFLIPVSNAGAGLPFGYFAAAAALWLILMSRAGVEGVGRWGSAGRHGMRRTKARGNSASQLMATGRGVGISALLAAVLLAAVLPHMPTRFFLDGLGRATDATGQSGARQITSTVNLAQSLEDQSTAPVLSYRTTAAIGPPMRVGTLAQYENGEWTQADPAAVGTPQEFQPPREDAPTASLEVTANNLGAPQLAMPYPAFGLEINSPWSLQDDASVRVERRVDEYRVDYSIPTPDEEALQSAAPAEAASSSDLFIDEDSAGAVRDVLDAILTPDMTQIDKARAIQAHLRGPAYTYSLTLAPPQVDDAGNEVLLDPISHFLATRQGYCTQFATAMIMMARAEGIPARFAIGFLPSAPGSDGLRTVVAADAHAWPELYFDGEGWLRFEPTPAGRAGVSPLYTAQRIEGGLEAPTDGPTTRPTTAPTIFDPLQERPDGASTPTTQAPPTMASRFLDRFGWLIVVIVLGALGTLVVPASAWLERRRRRNEATTDSDRVEVIWQDLLERLDDLGITTPQEATPRQAGRYIQDQTFLTQESRTSLRRIVSSVELARYSRPVDAEDRGLAVVTLERDARDISENVQDSLQRVERLRAVWWPTAGLRAWQRISRRAWARWPWSRGG